MKNFPFLILFLLITLSFPINAQTIDFENIGDYTTTNTEPFEINNSYFQNNFCIRFFENNIGGTTPRIGKVGKPASGYNRDSGPLTNSACGQTTATTRDMPNIGQDVGCYFLTTNSSTGPRPLIIDYESNCNCKSASGYIMDIDGRESWRVEVFDNDASATPIFSQDYSSGDVGTGDAVATKFEVGPFGVPIEKIRISYVGQGRPGFAFDNFSYCSIETTEPDSNYDLPICCPPMNQELMKDLFDHIPSGPITSPYKLDFNSNSYFSSVFQAYLEYIKVIDPSVQKLVSHWRFIDAGTGVSPNNVYSPMIEETHSWFVPGGSDNIFGNTNFFNASLNINRWYKIHTGIYTEPTNILKECKDALHFFYRVQISNGRLIGTISDGRKVIKRLDLGKSKSSIKKRGN